MASKKPKGGRLLRKSRLRKKQETDRKDDMTYYFLLVNGNYYMVQGRVKNA